MVDDGSTDDSFSKMCELCDKDPSVKAIKLKKNYGQQNAIMCGLHYAAGDYTVIMDDDLQNPPEEIEKLWIKILEGYDVVYGIPNQKLKGFYRFLGALMRDGLFDIFFPKPHGIKVSSFRIMRRKLVEEITKNKTSFVYISAITFQNRVKAANVNVNHAEREYGRSNYSLLKLCKALLEYLLELLSGFF